MAESLLRISQVQARTGLARSTIYRDVARGEFPKPVSLGARSVGWVESEVSDFIQRRIAQSRRQGAGA